MNPIMFLAFFLFGITCIAPSSPDANSAPNKPNPFFAFCMDTHDTKQRTLPQQAELLKELGYDGAAICGWTILRSGSTPSITPGSSSTKSR